MVTDIVVDEMTIPAAFLASADRTAKRPGGPTEDSAAYPSDRHAVEDGDARTRSC